MSARLRRGIRCVYLIIAHAQPKSVVRLARKIIEESSAAHVYIHYDASSGSFPIELLRDVPRATILDAPMHIEWGTFSQVEAILHSLRQLVRAEVSFDWLTLISGQDYPARPISDFEDMLTLSGADAFITYERISHTNRHLNDRYNFRYNRVLSGPLPRLVRARGLYDTFFNRIQPFVRIQTGPRGTFVGMRRHNPVMKLPMPIYKGWSWWAFSYKAVTTVLNTIEEQPQIIQSYIGTLSPDESIFQSIVVNAPSLTIRNKALHYADWTSGDASPLMLTLEHLPAIRHSQQWFARKIDQSNDGGLCDALDALRRTANGKQANRTENDVGGG